MKKIQFIYVSTSSITFLLYSFFFYYFLSSALIVLPIFIIFRVSLKFTLKFFVDINNKDSLFCFPLT